MGRSPCCQKEGLKRGPWTPEEDQKLLAFIEEHGHGSWSALPAKAGLQRCGKSCRLRWINYLRPDIKRGNFSLQEEQTIIQLHALLGNRWSTIATHVPKRTDNEIKNYWNTHLKKRLIKMGIDPATHKPKTDSLSPTQLKVAANLSHMAQWETARLQAESRESRLNTAPPQPLCLDILTASKRAISGNIFSATSLDSATSTLNFWTAAMVMNNFPELNDKIDPEELMNFPEMEYSNIKSNATIMTEGLADVLLEKNVGAVYCGDFEENDKNYWNSILNLVNCSPSGTSPVF